MKPERIINPELTEEEIRLEVGLRPKGLSEFIGQEEVKNNLKVFIQAALERGEALDHVLLYGFPGLGKTTLANIIAQELKVNLKGTSGPVIERPGDLAALLTNLHSQDCLFIDEIHRLNHVVEEILYPAMEDFQLDIMIGQGPSARSIKLDLPKVHPDRGDDPGRFAHPAVAGPFRGGPEGRFLFFRRVEDHPLSISGDSEDTRRRGRNPGDCPSIPGNTPGGEPDSQASQGFCPGQSQWVYYP